MSKKITKEKSYKNVYRNMEYETEMYYVYSDIVNHRNLAPVAFFKYIHENYRSITNLNSIIKEMEKKGLIFCCNNIKLIIDYKEALLMHNKKLQEKLESKFRKIEDAKEVLNKNVINESLYYGDINKDIDNYLSENEGYNRCEYEKLIYKIQHQISDVDNEKYVTFIDRKHNVKSIDIKEIDELIEILKYFIKNLETNLWEFEFYHYVLETRKEE